MMDRAVGPWWLLRMVSWGDAPSWDGMGPLARKNPPASRAIWIVRPSSAPTAHRHPSPGIAQTWLKNQQSSVDNHQSNLSEKIRGISDGMKSFSNRRWADRKVWFNVPRGTRECLQQARVAEGPKVR